MSNVTIGDHWQHVENPRGPLAALQAAWPGVKVSRLIIDVDTRSPMSIAGPDYADRLDVTATIAGKSEALLVAGLVVAADLASEGTIRFGRGSSITVGARRVRLNVYYSERRDEHRENPQLMRVIDAMAAALLPAIWQPPR